MRDTDNSYLLDGFDNNIDDTSFDVAQAEVVKPSVDAIQEFKVQTNAYPAQFGSIGRWRSEHQYEVRKQRFHGTAYNFVSNEFFDARDDFNQVNRPLSSATTTAFPQVGPFSRIKRSSSSHGKILKLRESYIDNNTIPTAQMQLGQFLCTQRHHL